MTDLFEKSIRTLELPAVLEKLAAKAVSDAAKERCLRLTPATDTQEVLHLLDETDAAKERLAQVEAGELTLTDEELAEQQIYQNTIRLSIGTEHIDDIIADLEAGFAAVRGE